jgi:MATE family multidrug resistance protein
MHLSRFRARHLAGPGGIAALWVIALPMILSQGFDTAMMFIDRLYLSRLGKEYLAACMAGGLTSFMTMAFPIGVVGYVTALVAHRYGAGRRPDAARALTQALLLAVAAWPLVLAAGMLVVRGFALAGHAPLQEALETEYYRILLLGSGLGLLRTALAGFFSGIGRTRVILLANAAGFVVNVVLNYVLIFGRFGFPEMRMGGAAWGTVLGSLAATLVLAAAYLRPALCREFAIGRAWRPDGTLLRALLRYGTPCGVEFFLNIAAFTFVVALFHAYGAEVAAAVTIAFNWDLVAFLPMIGVQVAVMSLVGQNLGAGNRPEAVRAAYSGMKIAGVYALGMTLAFVLVPGPLVRLFAPDLPGLDYASVVPLAKAMLMTASLYILSDATFLVFSGALRGAGDTHWAMRTSVALHWTMAAAALFCIRVLRTPPLTAWIVFVLCVLMMGTTFFLRFRSGRWRTLELSPDTPPPVAVPEPLASPLAE